MRLPQARDFDRLRLLLSLIASGLQDRTALGQKMGAKAQYAARHADYYREAAEILGLLDRPLEILMRHGAGLSCMSERFEYRLCTATSGPKKHPQVIEVLLAELGQI
jgi:hypothetical protein